MKERIWNFERLQIYQDISYVITFPNTPEKIRRVDLKMGKFVAIVNDQDKENYFLIGKIIDLPINSLSSNTWVDVYKYIQRDNIFTVVKRVAQIQVSEVFCTIQNLEKVRKGVYKLKVREIKKIEIGITNKFIK